MAEILKSRNSFLDLVQVGFILTDVHSKILFANRYTKRLFGYAKEEMEGERIRVLFLEEDLIYFLPNIIYLSLYKNGFDGEALLRQKDGAKVFVHLYTTTFNEGGEVFISFSFQEIQRLKKLERERGEMERWADVGMKVEEVVRQIRNPIVGIGSHTERLLRTLSPSQKGKPYLQRILRETKGLETMIQRLEEYVLFPKPAFRRERIDKVVEAVLETFSKEAARNGVLFNLETGTLEGEEDLFIDRDLVSKALYHIFENSLEAVLQKPTGKRGRVVRVSLSGEEGNIGISISDKGEGIPQKNLGRVFEPFFSTRPGRVGLGLSFAKKVVEEQGGRIGVESRLRKGTTITLTFPKDRRRILRREQLSAEGVGTEND